jgi:riboflavin synthase
MTNEESMFTGIIEAQGKLQSLTPKGGDLTLTVHSDTLGFADVKLGDSVAVSGVCLTVTVLDAHSFSADVSRETLSLTSLGQLKPGNTVNLEKAMQPSSRFGGHIVSGHVDGLGKVVKLTPDARSTRIDVEAPAELAKYIAHKGSITVDGISLTVNEVRGAIFSLNIIPHTAEVTTIGEWQVGSRVNLEVDIIARYLERLLLGEKAAQANSDISSDFLAQPGFRN